MKRIISVLFIAALMLCFTIFPLHAAKALDGGVTVILTADNVVYQPGETAEITLAITNRNEYPINTNTALTLPEGMKPIDAPLTDTRTIAPGESAVIRTTVQIYGETLEEAGGSKIVLIVGLIVAAALIIVLIIRYHKAKESVGAILLCLLCLGQANVLSATEPPEASATSDVITTVITVEETVSLSGDDRIIQARVEVESAANE